MPRFVILEHDHPFLHWDLMLEHGSILRTWRLESPPCAGTAISATAVFDHRLLYLDYEGPISGGRGCVVRWDRGTFTGEVQNANSVIVHLHGEQVRGIVNLEQIEGDTWNCECRVEEDAAVRMQLIRHEFEAGKRIGEKST